MSKESLILLFSWLFALTLLWLFIPKKKKRTAHITFLFVQTIAWLIQYIQVVFNLMKFPVREFPNATHMSFSLYFIVYPTFGVLFILFYPEAKDRIVSILYTILFSMVTPTYTYFVEKYSSFFSFQHWNWFTGLVTNMAILILVKRFVFWFKSDLCE